MKTHVQIKFALIALAFTIALLGFVMISKKEDCKLLWDPKTEQCGPWSWEYINGGSK